MTALVSLIFITMIRIDYKLQIFLILVLVQALQINEMQHSDIHCSIESVVILSQKHSILLKKLKKSTWKSEL